MVAPETIGTVVASAGLLRRRYTVQFHTAETLARISDLSSKDLVPVHGW